MQVTSAAERLTKLEFEADKDYLTYPRSVYQCPHCKETVSFCLCDFDRHSFSDFTNLSEEHAKSVHEAATASKMNFNSFLDFYCSRCKAPVRIYYVAWAGGRYTHGHSVRFVVEGDSFSP